MKVKELIKCLQQQNQEAEVNIVVTTDEDESDSYFDCIRVEQATYEDITYVSIRG